MTTQDLIDETSEMLEKNSDRMPCLGMTNENDEARRTYYTDELEKSQISGACQIYDRIR